MRSALCVIFLIIFFITTIPFLGLAFVLGFFSKSLQYRFTFIFARIWARGLLLAAGTQVEVLGIENIPKGPVLFVGNHRGWFDIPIVYSYLPKATGFVAKEEIKKVPFLSWWMSSIGCLFINRTDVRKAMETIVEGINLLKGGHSLVIFPEGTRSKSSEMLPFKQGSLKLAEKANVAIMPFAVKGSDHILENNGLNVTSAKIKLSFGNPILLGELTPEERKSSAQYVQTVVQKLYEEKY
jgi:1-acyl-sn-glycerol-3-phosphate acyltransferase